MKQESTTNDHLDHMRHALELAQLALDRGEFPVGCIITYQGQVVARGERRGTRRQVPSELDHAEMIALRHLESLSGPMDRKAFTLYATLEPCLMCFGALLISGIGTIVYAYEDAMGGGTTCDRHQLAPLYQNNAVRIVPGIGRNRACNCSRPIFQIRTRLTGAAACWPTTPFRNPDQPLAEEPTHQIRYFFLAIVHTFL